MTKEQKSLATLNNNLGVTQVTQIKLLRFIAKFITVIAVTIPLLSASLFLAMFVHNNSYYSEASGNATFALVMGVVSTILVTHLIFSSIPKASKE